MVAALAFQASALAGPGYDFVKRVDHAEDNLGPRTLTCASLNGYGAFGFYAPALNATPKKPLAP